MQKPGWTRKAKDSTAGNGTLPILKQATVYELMKSDRSKARNVLAIMVLIVASLAGTAVAGDFALSVYGGRMTGENWEDTLSPDVDFRDAYIGVVAGAWTIERYYDEALSLELEAQVARYFGDQDNWEFNLPVLALRWNRFPWDNTLDISFAWGIGPSYASHVPEVEVEINDSSEKWMVYWFAEFTFGPPQGRWALLLRLHHRSEAYGLVADEGGSNTMAAGLKIYF